MTYQIQLDKSIDTKEKFKRETLGRYLTSPFQNTPNAMFGKYLNSVEIDKLHAEFLGEAAEIEHSNYNH